MASKASSEGVFGQKLDELEANPVLQGANLCVTLGAVPHMLMLVGELSRNSKLKATA